MKKFNTDHIRRRMRDQKERYGSKGLGLGLLDAGSAAGGKTLISSPPIRVPIPFTRPPPYDDDDGGNEYGDIEHKQQSHQQHQRPFITIPVDKENVVNSVVVRKVSVSPGCAGGGAQPRPPPLAVTVTMDDDDGEEDSGSDKNDRHDDDGPDEVEVARSVASKNNSHHGYAVDGFHNEGKEEKEEDTSVWAMMEHYQDDEDDEQRGSVSPSEHLYRPDNDGLSLPTFSLSEPLVNGSESAAGSSLPDDEQQQQEPLPVGDHVRKIHWQEDDNGSLIQASIYTHDESHLAMEDYDHEDDANSTENENSSHEYHHRDSVFRSEDGCSLGGMHQSSIVNSRSNEITKQLLTRHEIATPAKVRQEFLDESLDVKNEQDDAVSTESGSLLQQSMIGSVQKDTQKLADKSPQDNTSPSVTSLQLINQSHLSLPSLGISEPESVKQEEPKGRALFVRTKTPEVDSTDGNGNRRDVARIEELEHSIRQQRSNTNQVQDRLKTRVEELEQALRVTAATPRGTIIHENPLKTLLDRNQTLVKEVRFADQTCVELSNKNVSLASQIKKLKEQMATLEEENGDLRLLRTERQKEADHIASQDAETIQMLRTELEHAKANQNNEEIVLNMVQEAIEAWNTASGDDDGLAAMSTASDIVSEPGSFVKATCTNHNKVVGSSSLARSIHQLVGKLLSENVDTFQDNNSRGRVETEFLGRQLGKAQEKLDQTQNLLDTERSRSEALELQLKRGAETYIRLIEPLERRLLEATQAASTLPPGLMNADVRLFGLEKELAHAKASLSAIKRESERLLREPNLRVEMIADTKQNEEVVAMVQTAFLRMGQQYKKLEVDVEAVVDNLVTRMEKMTETVSFLRSSLLFESEAVVSPRRPAEIEMRPISRQVDAFGVDGMIATIQRANFQDDDDELYQMMEEARSPRECEIDISSDLDDITLESLVKSVSVLSPISHAADRFKEPLEAAIRECQRVRERSSKLKQEVENKMATIQQLQKDKSHLLLESMQRRDELQLVKKALDLSQKQLEAMETALKSSEIEMNHTAELQKRERAAIERDNEMLHAETRRLRDQESTITKLLQERESKLVQVKSELNVMAKSHDDLVVKMSSNNQDKEEASRLLAKINELEATHKQLLSDLEDRELETQCAREDSRKERAELKSSLSQKAQEVSSLKSSLASTKAKHQAELEKKETTIRQLEAEQSCVIDNLQVLAKMRTDIWEKLQYCGVCDELSSLTVPVAGSLSTIESAIQEIQCLVAGLPYIGAQFEELHATAARLPEMESECNDRTEQLELLETREVDLLKQLEDEKVQNEELFDLLQQADCRVEESLAQVKAMQDHINAIQEQEHEARIQAQNAEAEIANVRESLEQCLAETREDLSKSQSDLNEVTAELEAKNAALTTATTDRDTAQSQLKELSMQLELVQSEEGSLKATIQSLEQKCSRLREYIKKLTDKCAEWETSYDRQAKAIERLQDKNRRVSARYKELAGEQRRKARMHKEDRAKWSSERSNLHQVHVTLEQELEEIAKELAMPVEVSATAME